MATTPLTRVGAPLLAAWLLFAALALSTAVHGVGAVVDPCNAWGNTCRNCTSNASPAPCAWCSATSQCVSNTVAGACPTGWASQSATACECAAYTRCGPSPGCNYDAACGWCGGSAYGDRCLAAGTTGNTACTSAQGTWTTFFDSCPAPAPPPAASVCTQYSGSKWGCIDCVTAVNATDGTACAWCQSLKQCAPSGQSGFLRACYAADDNNGFDLHNYVDAGDPLLCLPPPFIALSNILLATVGSGAMVAIVAAVYVAHRATIDERFGRDKVFLFDDSSEDALKTRTLAKWVRHIQLNHPLLSLFYRGARDPYGALQRTKWFITAVSGIMMACVFTAVAQQSGMVPNWVVTVVSFCFSAFMEVQMWASVRLYRHQCDCCDRVCDRVGAADDGSNGSGRRPKGKGGKKQVSTCSAVTYDCFCVTDNCACGTACGVRAYCWDWLQVCGSTLTVGSFFLMLATDTYPLVYGPGALVATLAGVAQTWLVAVVTSAAFVVFLPGMTTDGMNAYLRKYGGAARDGSDVLTAYGQLANTKPVSNGNAAASDDTNPNGAYVPPSQTTTTLVVDGAPHHVSTTPLMPKKAELSDAAAAAAPADASSHGTTGAHADGTSTAPSAP